MRPHRRELPLAEALPLIIFGGTCVALAVYLLVSGAHAYLGRYALWPYLVTIGAIAAGGGTASLFATWEEEPTPQPDEIIVPRSEWEDLRRATSHVSAGPGRASGTDRLLAPVDRLGDWLVGSESSPGATDAPRSDGTVRAASPSSRPPVDLGSAAPAPPSPPAELPEEPAEAPAASDPSAETPRNPEVETAVESPATPVAIAPPAEAPLSPAGGTPAATEPAASPSSESNATPVVLNAFLAHLRPLVEHEGERSKADARPPSEPPKVMEPPAAPASAEILGEGAASAEPSPTVPEEAGSGEIEHEFDRLLEALATGGPSTSGRDEPLCVGCDRPVKLPYVSCQSCGNPLCADCRAQAAEDGHPRRCPTCALLQKYS